MSAPPEKAEPTVPAAPVAHDDRPAQALRGEEAGAGAPPAAEADRSRYRRVDGHDGDAIACGSTPNIRLHVQRGLTVDEEGRARYPRQTIFLDGAYTGAPFLDNESRQYSFDHHAGCVRAFTLASCEQAAVMLLRGLPLDEGEWHLYINDPDLDAVLAAWLLLNHAELLANGAVLLGEAMPFVRVQGLIDAHGLDMELLLALPEASYNLHRERIEQLLAPARRHKEAGEWGSIDLTGFTLALLQDSDRTRFPAGYLDQLLSIDELGRIALRGGKLAVMCHSQQGIYDVETQLKQRYDKQLGLILLDQGESRITLRQVDRFLDRNLNDLYPVLNKRDPRARPAGDSANQWGGSDDIGGSPRATGTGLEPTQLMQAVEQVYGPRSWLKRLFRRR